MKIKAHCPFLGYTGYNAHARGFITALSHCTDLRVDNYTWCDDRESYLTPHQKSIISEITLRGAHGSEGQHPPDWKGGVNDPIEEFDHDISLILHEHNHKVYWRKFDKPTIAYCVWETERFSDNFFHRLSELQELWVPSQWQKDCAIDQGLPADKVQVVPEAVEADCYPDPTIQQDDSVFTFCLMGRWDRRKSTTEIIRTFVELYGNNPQFRLIVSIENPHAFDRLNTAERLQKLGWGHINNIFIKPFPPREEYLNILRSSHVFLSCARAEGWNIPLIEAMACGTPSIYSDCSGQTEFAQGKGIPIRVIGREVATAGEQEVATEFTADLPGHFFTPDFEHLKRKMEEVALNYSHFKAKALEESSVIRSEYTWEKAAATAKSHLDRFYTRYVSKEKAQKTIAKTPIKQESPPVTAAIIPKKSETPKNSPIKILLPLITYNGMCHTEFAMKVMSTVLQIRGTKGMDMVITPITFESLISRARNAAAALALSENYTHLLFIDSDITFEPSDLFKLLNVDKEIAVGLYPKKYYSSVKMEALSKHAPHVFNKDNEWKKLATDFSSEFDEVGFNKAKDGKPFQVDYAATGFMLIKTDVLRTIVEKRPDLKYRNEIDGYMSANQDCFYDFFKVGVNPTTLKYESEDYGFCNLWRSLGGSIWALPDITLTHTGRDHYPGDMIGQANIFLPNK